MKKQISHISLHQTAKVIAIISFVLLEIGAIFLTLAVMLGINMETPDAPSSETWGPLFFLIFPIFYALFIYLYVLVFGFFYNLIAKHFGGIEVEVSDKDVIVVDKTKDIVT